MKQLYLDILQRYWGYDSFRGIQTDIIKSIGEGRDTLGLMPTGGGKSICFQVPALAAEGLCLVVTPLIALMKDQVWQLKARGIKAAAVHAGMTREQILITLDNCILGDYKFLYVSPERICTETFRQKFIRIPKVNMIAVDEAHCVSQWGYDFRPQYLRISELRGLVSYHIPLLALTATATPEVVEDIQDKLQMRGQQVFKMSFERKNLIYVVRQARHGDKFAELLHILTHVPGSAIVYVRDREKTAQIANGLIAQGITAHYYHAGISDAEKEFKQKDWIKGKTRVMVATNAFGMGIDKADVRLVVHYKSPLCLEDYYQEAGRAGRDGKPSYCVMIYDDYDKTTIQNASKRDYPPKDFIRQVYEDVCCYLNIAEGEGEDEIRKFDINVFCHRFRYYPQMVEAALHLLASAGYLSYEERPNSKTLVYMLIQRQQMYGILNNNPHEDRLLEAILRHYCGIFSEYVPVEEALLSQATGFSEQYIYDLMTNMRRMGIMSFIPRCNTPTITLTIPRVDTNRVVLGEAVYDSRKRSFEKRISTMCEYLTSTTRCRSRILIEYLGEAKPCDCGQCDVCLAKAAEGQASDSAQQSDSRQQSDGEQQTDSRQQTDSHAPSAIDTMLGILQDGEWHTAAELRSACANEEEARAAINNLRDYPNIEINLLNIRLKA